ncbi:MAG: cellulose biosynthesis cyclic di-GMP-binding regulatory protein BcsB [Variovorax sp.]|nr:MAG: cellulose biosynthesis cyclic di-GMP-binding regulatory protein BcsB [Variovorax sp.]
MQADFSSPGASAWPRLSIVTLALLAWAGGAADPAVAQVRAPGAAPAVVTTASPAAPPPATEGALREFNLTQLGLNYAVKLRGVSGTVGIPFSVRADELVTGASLRLNYAYSPSMIPELSHLKVSVNDVLVSTLALPRDGAGKAQTVEIPIDRRLVTDFNRINVELVGHYTRECEDPQHSSLWTTIDASSTLRLNVTPLKTASDLAVLPQPFFDRRDVRRANIPFVFGGTPSSGTLEVAGIVSSWFGALAGYRGATFPVSNDALPAGNAVVFATPETAIAGLTLPAITGPTVAVVDHPANPTRKLLLVMGRNPGELRNAATALTLNARAFTGTSATIPSLQETPARKPYDAPRWIASDRAVQLGELAQAPDFNVSGYTPDVVKVNLQMPPDLFTWRSRGIPLDIKYRYTPRPRNDQSTLNVSVNDNFIGSLPLRTANPGGDRWWNPLATKVMADGTAAQQREVLLPPLAMGSRSQLRMHYYFQPAAGNCQTLLDNVRGAIDPTSTIDISAFPHYMAMPELAAYANSGFPFTRLADLAETAVVLPDQPAAADTETYLALLGQIGNATGYPALRVAVGRAANVSQWADKDLLVIGNLQNQPLFTEWAERMPLRRKAAAQQEFSIGQWVDDYLPLITGTRQREDLPNTTQMTVAEDGSDAVLAGFESPLRAGRSVVAVVSNAASQGALLDALMTPELLQRVQGSTAIVRGAQVNSVLTGESYYVGKLPPMAWLQWNLSRSPLGLAGAAVLLALLGAAAAYASLQRVARRRLRQ